MKLISCLFPKTIINPYTHEKQVVPCGKCAACQNKRAASWKHRLDLERQCWKYAVFFTLTFNDENLPVLNSFGDLYVNGDHCHQSKDDPMICMIKDDIMQRCTDKSAVLSFFNQHQSIPFLSKYDVQCFVKRLRINLYRLHKKLNSNESSQIRYFICGEYGPEHGRPHYHGLFFFNSELTASHIEELIRTSWKYGFVTSSFVSGSNASYVASYLNCTSHLSEVYTLFKPLRPFHLCSKCPPIGSLAVGSEEIRRIFNDSDVEMCIRRSNGKSFGSEPLFRYVKDWIFPKLRSFDSLDHNGRVALYGCANKVPSYFTSKQFVNWAKSSLSGRSHFINDYIATVKSIDYNAVDFALMNLFRISKRVCLQADIFGVSVSQYVDHIDKFYSKLELLKLKNQYEEIESKIVVNKVPLQSFACLDAEFLQSCMDAVDFYDLDITEQYYLCSFGIDVQKFFSDDGVEKYSYRSSLLPQNQWFYNTFALDQEIIRNLNCKTKAKNEYLRYQFKDPVF